MKCINLIIKFQGNIESIISYVSKDTEIWSENPVNEHFIGSIKELSPDIWEKFTEEDWNDYVEDGYFVYGNYEFIIHHSLHVHVSPCLKG
jgi:hypothetical protein